MRDLRHTPTHHERWKHPWIHLSIWSLKQRDHLNWVVRMVMWSFSALVLLAVIAGKIDLETALRVFAYGGLSAVVLLTGLVLIRRKVLLGIDDPIMREEAHQAMIALMRSRASIHPAGRASNDRDDRSGADRCSHPGGCGR